MGSAAGSSGLGHWRIGSMEEGGSGVEEGSWRIELGRYWPGLGA